MLIECKWQELTKKDVKHIMRKLKKKSESVPWYNDIRTEYFGVIAKKIYEKEDLKKDDIISFDLRDF